MQRQTFGTQHQQPSFVRRLALAVIIAALVALIFRAFEQPVRTGKIVFADQTREIGETVTVKCPFKMPRSHRARCVRTYAPQNWQSNTGPMISILAVILEPWDGATKDDPFVYLEGGPGFAGVPKDDNAYGRNGWLRFQYKEILSQGRSMIFVDTRGLGGAEPALHCPDATEMAWQDLKNRPENRLGTKVLSADIACFDAMRTAGVDLSAYNSKNNGRDLRALREGLNIEQWNLYGVSYGAQTALNALQADPRGIRSVIFDSPSYDRVEAFVDDQAAFDRVLGQIDTRCNQSKQALWQEACDRDIRDRLADVIRNLRRDPSALRSWPFAKPVYLSDREAIHVLHDALYRADGHERFLALLNTMENMKRGYWSSLSNDAMDWRDTLYWSYLDEDFSSVVHYTTACQEMNYRPDPPDSPWPIYTHEEATYQRDLCDAMGLRWDGSTLNASDFSEAPALVLSGDKDVITPPSYGKALADDMGAHYYLSTEDSHGVMFWSRQCILDAATNFVETLRYNSLTMCRG